LFFGIKHATYSKRKVDLETKQIRFTGDNPGDQRAAAEERVAEPGAMMKARLSVIEGVNNRVKKRFALALHDPQRSVEVFPRALDKMREEERVSFEEAVMALKLTNRQRRRFYHYWLICDRVLKATADSLISNRPVA
jgi:hypothetical protein